MGEIEIESGITIRLRRESAQKSLFRTRANQSEINNNKLT